MKLLAPSLALVLALLLTTPEARAGTDPDRDWFTLESAHFAVHSYDGGEAMARRVASAAEDAKRLVDPLLGYSPKERVHILLVDDVDGTNGFAWVAPHDSIVLYAAGLPLFVVDASGSSALQRLAEAKGAVRLLLAECYVRRDEVALIAFRRSEAEIVLPPTRSLVAAERALSGANITFASILHPSPASPAANKGWAEAAEKTFLDLGVWPSAVSADKG